MLAVDKLRKSFGGTVAADDVSFPLAAGGSLGLVGESGSGKSTIARMLVGLVTPDSGTITVGGRARGAKERGREARLRRAREIQIVFQDPYVSLDPRLTATQCLHTALALHGRERSRAAELLDQVGLGSREAAARPHQLSGGQRQRLAIARALAVEPAVLILDEAVAALDVSIQAQILELLARVRRESGVALLFVSHDLAVVRHLCDEALVLHRGVVVEHGPVEQVLADPRHPYTRSLLDSVPHPGWDPAHVTRWDGARR
ncbi:ABC transporter ATP-binding protein [Nonomuraea muscovyensis]